MKLIPLLLLTSVEWKWQSVECFQKATENKINVFFFHPNRKRKKKPMMPDERVWWDSEAETSRKKGSGKWSIRCEGWETFQREVIFCVGTHTGLLQRLIHHIYCSYRGFLFFFISVAYNVNKQKETARCGCHSLINLWNKQDIKKTHRVRLLFVIEKQQRVLSVCVDSTLY